MKANIYTAQVNGKGLVLAVHAATIDQAMTGALLWAHESDYRRVGERVTVEVVGPGGNGKVEHKSQTYQVPRASGPKAKAIEDE